MAMFLSVPMTDFRLDTQNCSFLVTSHARILIYQVLPDRSLRWEDQVCSKLENLPYLQYIQIFLQSGIYEIRTISVSLISVGELALRLWSFLVSLCIACLYISSIFFPVI